MQYKLCMKPPTLTTSDMHIYFDWIFLIVPILLGTGSYQSDEASFLVDKVSIERNEIEYTNYTSKMNILLCTKFKATNFVP